MISLLSGASVYAEALLLTGEWNSYIRPFIAVRISRGKPQAACQLSTSALSAVPSLPSNKKEKEATANLQVLSSPWLLVTPLPPPKKTPLQRFYLLIHPPSSFSIPPLPFRVGTQHQSPQEALAKHKNNFFLVNLLLQIGSTQGMHFHALCLLQLFKRSSYARKHKLIHKPTGHSTTKEMEIWSFRGNLWVLRHVKAHLTQLRAIHHSDGTL